MNILFLSPYHGGSHAAWAEGYAAKSRHQVRALTMPDRFWKWRMHGGAVTLANRFLEQSEQADLLVATDMLDLSTFLALTRRSAAAMPAVLYMHENQLTYPLPEDGRMGPMRRQHGERDYHYVFINYASMLAADHVFFNSSYHMESFFAALPTYLKRFPEYNERRTIPLLIKKSSVLPVGINFSRLDPPESRQPETTPLIVWNQRWEYDKNPEALFAALFQIAEEGIPFRLALCGQQYGKRPLIFDEAAGRLQEQIIHMGFADQETYRTLLWQADLTISTAVHEFFGISICEAIYCHTFPILPNRLSYPELLPNSYHNYCLYEDRAGLLSLLRQTLSQRGTIRRQAAELANHISQFSWSQIAPQYDASLTQIWRDFSASV